MRTGIILLFAVFAFSTFSMTQSSHKRNRPATDSVRLLKPLHSPQCRRSTPSVFAHMFASCRMICSKAAEPGSAVVTLQRNTSPLNLPFTGLKPVGDFGSFMQKVPMVGITPAPENHVFAGHVVRHCHRPEAARTICQRTIKRSNRILTWTLRSMYVGYGIVAPEYQSGRLQKEWMYAAKFC